MTPEEQRRAQRRAAMTGQREYAISRPPRLPSPDIEPRTAGSADAAEARMHLRYAADLIEALS